MEVLTIAGWLLATGLLAALLWSLQQRQRLEETLRQLTAQNQDLSRSIQRALEDRDQTVKRVQRESESRARFGHEPLLRDLLPVLDNLERALNLQEDAQGGLRDGVRMICDQLSSDLRRHGVTQIQTEESFFDPRHHEAVQSAPSAEHPPGKILSQWQRGYLLHERLLRPARVVVASEPPPEPTPPEPTPPEPTPPPDPEEE